MKIGLVLEGGAMRGMYTAGVLDTFLNKDFLGGWCYLSFSRGIVRRKLPF